MSQRCFLARACALPLAPFECGGVSLLVLVCVPLCGNPVRTECGNVCVVAKIYRPIFCIVHNVECCLECTSRAPPGRGTWMAGLRGEGPRLLQQAAQLALLLQRGEARSA